MKKNRGFPVAISFHIFARPELTKLVFEKIREVRPEKLFVTADGPRENSESDQENCAATRAVIDNIDWDCELRTNFSDSNKGSFKSTSEGISWVFQQVDRAIILEDDCIPDTSFFHFCHELLDYYENDQRVSMISGTDFQTAAASKPHSYYFSRYSHMWGWACWKRTWENVDFSMERWPEFRDMRGLEMIFRREGEVRYWHSIMQRMYDGELGPHWDYLLMLSMFLNSGLVIRPSVNLVSNAGYGEGATHFDDKTDMHDILTGAMSFPLVHPGYLCRDLIADEAAELREFGGDHECSEMSRIGRFIRRQGRRLKSLYPLADKSSDKS